MALTLTQYDNIVDYLQKTYDVGLYEWLDRPHPILFYAADGQQRHDVDSIAGRLTAQKHNPDDYGFYNYGHLNTLRNAGRNLFDGTTFDLTRIRQHPLRVDAQLGSYFDMIATCDALDQELRAAAHMRFMRVPQRAQLHRTLSPAQALRDGRGRAATLGVITLIVFKHGEQYVALMSRRSDQAATDPGTLYMLPAFIWQPMRPDGVHDVEWRVSHHIYREYLEELFAMPEENAPDDPTYFYEHPALVYLRDLMASGEASLYLTGLSFNLLTLRAEVATLLLIRTPDWYERITAADSDMPLNASTEARGGQLVYLPIATDADLQAAMPAHPYLNMPPQAISTLAEGVRLARQMLS